MVLKCPAFYAYRKIIGGDDTSAPLVKGTLGHIGLAHFYARTGCIQRGLDPERFYAPLDAMDAKVVKMVTEKTPGYELAQEYIQTMKHAVTMYMQTYLHEQLNVQAVEVPVEMHIGGHRITQRFDLVVADRSDRIWIYDHKFLGSISKATVERYTLSGQFLEMVWQGRHHYGDRFGGVRINMISVDGEKFERATPSPAPSALAAFEKTVQDAEARIEAFKHLAPEDYPRVFSEQICVGPYGRCPAYTWCQWGG